MALGENPAQKGSHPVPEVRTFTPRMKSLFLLELTKTGSIVGAAARVGIGKSTVYDHAQKDRTFAEDIERARGDWEQAALEQIAKAGEVGSVTERKNGTRITEPGDWRATAWLLEHNPAYRERYAGILRQKVEMSGSEDMPPIQIEGRQTLEIGPDTMERLAQVVGILIRTGKLRLPDPNEIEGTAKDVTNGDT